jgi:hypothetical protein
VKKRETVAAYGSGTPKSTPGKRAALVAAVLARKRFWTEKF